MDQKIEILGNTYTGLETISLVIRYTPDVLIITPNLPDMEIIDVIRRISRQYPTPSIVLWTEEDQSTVNKIKNLDLGIIDFVKIDRRNNIISLNDIAITTRVHILSKLEISKFLTKIQNAIRGSKSSHNSRQIRLTDKRGSQKKYSSNELEESVHYSGKGRTHKIIIIGTSTGGPKLLTDIIPKFPNNIPPIIIVQHMPIGFIKAFAKRLNKLTPLVVKEAVSGDLLLSGHIYLAPGGFHLEIHQVKTSSPTIFLSDAPPVNFVKPSVDITLESASKIYGAGVISVILTGMGSDGKKGCKVVKKRGGRVLALDKVDSDIYGMNKAVIEAGLVDEILKKKDLVSGIIRAIES